VEDYHLKMKAFCKGARLTRRSFRFAVSTLCPNAKQRGIGRNARRVREGRQEYAVPGELGRPRRPQPNRDSGPHMPGAPRVRGARGRAKKDCWRGPENYRQMPPNTATGPLVGWVKALRNPPGFASPMQSSTHRLRRRLEQWVEALRNPPSAIARGGSAMPQPTRSNYYRKPRPIRNYLRVGKRVERSPKNWGTFACFGFLNFLRKPLRSILAFLVLGTGLKSPASLPPYKAPAQMVGCAKPSPTLQEARRRLQTCSDTIRCFYPLADLSSALERIQ
jgi:hypothetical protein